ncbi:MAG: outer membrane beta-barrel protein [Bacteroidia bacterium]|nr:outer membrane beta-barrel protein [Bacteroidia bacterium]
MKKLILSLAFVAAGAGAFAQIGQGSLMLGGNLGFSSGGGGEIKATGGGVADKTTELTSTSDWNFSPSVGYFLTDNIAIGVRLGLGGTNRGQATAADGTTKENYSSFDFSAELFGRYYMEVATNLYFFGDAGLGFGSSSWTDRVSDAATSQTAFKDSDKNSFSGFGINIAPGLAFFPSEKWGIDFTLNRIIGFNMNTFTNETPNPNSLKTETSTSAFNIGFGLNPTIGLHYYMGK